MAAPVYESFNKADSSTLGPALIWTEVNDDSEVKGLAAHAVTTAGALNTSARAGNDLGSTDHYVTSAVTTYVKSGGNMVGICARFSSSANTYYSFLVTDGTPNQRAFIEKVVAGSETQLTSDYQFTVNAGDILRFEVRGSLLIGSINGTVVLSVTDSSITTGSRCGIQFYRVDASSDGRLQQYAAGDLLGLRVPSPLIESAFQYQQLGLLPLHQKRLADSVRPVTGFSQDTLGSFTSSGYGQVAPQDIPQQLLTAKPVTGIQQELFRPLFQQPTPRTGFSQQTLGPLSSAGYGQVAPAPNLPIQQQVFEAPQLGVQLPLLGPAFFTARTVTTTVSGTVAATLAPFISSATGTAQSVTQPALFLLATPPQGVQLPLFGPAFFAAKLVVGTITATLGGCTSSGTGGHGPNGTGSDTLDGFSSSAAGGYGPNGTVAAALAALVCVAVGTVVSDHVDPDPNPYRRASFLDGRRATDLDGTRATLLDGRKASDLDRSRHRFLDGRRERRH